jgi:hypothetical protein
MFTRRFKQAFARLCIALLCMQAVVSAYACPAFLGDLQNAAAPSAQDEHAHHGAAMPGDCGEHNARNTADRNMCHQHYAGDQSVGAATLASAAAPVALPLAFASVIEPAAAMPGHVLPVLLQRITSPPLSIRFQVLRI